MLRSAARFVRSRFWGFGLVGIGVLVAGTALLYLLVNRLHVETHLAYAIQAVFSIEANFFLNRFLNWRDRGGWLGRQWFRFHVTKIGTLIFNQALFATCLAFGLHYLLAQVLCVAVTTVLNYSANDTLVFVDDHPEPETTQLWALPKDGAAFKVGVVLPVRNSGRTIQRCIRALLAQDYRHFHIYVVGNPADQDNTWSALGLWQYAPRITCLHWQRPAGWVGRDANAKRSYGAQAAIDAGCDVVALIDSQVEAPRDWLRASLSLLQWKQVDGVAGISCRHPEDHSFASRYQDGSLFSEWPRYGKAYLLDKRNFSRARGLPITANLVLWTRTVQRMTVPWPHETPHGWDDFHLAWSLVASGATFLCTDLLPVYRLHAPKFRLVKHFASGMAAFDFWRKFPDSGYAQRRLLQGTLVALVGSGVLVAALLALLLHALAVLSGLGLFVLLGFLLLSMRSMEKTRDWRGLFFPVLDSLHIGVWIAGAAFALGSRDGGSDQGVAAFLVSRR